MHTEKETIIIRVADWQDILARLTILEGLLASAQRRIEVLEQSTRLAAHADVVEGGRYV